MMRFLVDANVLSEPTKTRPHPSVDEWLDRHKADSAVNPIILGELEYGILLLPNGGRRTRLLEWFSMGASRLHVIELDRETAKVWAGILATLRRKGRDASERQPDRSHGAATFTNCRHEEYGRLPSCRCAAAESV